MLHAPSQLIDLHPGFNVFRHVTFRTFMGGGTSFCLSLLLGNWMIGCLRAIRAHQVIRAGGVMDAIGFLDDYLKLRHKNSTGLREKHKFLLQGLWVIIAVLAEYLQVPLVRGAHELTVFCGCLLGAGLGFLWWNAYPAKVFMGDTGSLAFGGTLAMVAILIKHEVTLVIAGFVFVAEAGGVLIQRYWFKYNRKRFGTGRKVFLMAPIHHHFELAAGATPLL